MKWQHPKTASLIYKFVFRRLNPPSPKSVQLESIFPWNGSSKSERTSTIGIYISFSFTTYNKFSQGNRDFLCPSVYLPVNMAAFRPAYRKDLGHISEMSFLRIVQRYWILQLRHVFKWIQMQDRLAKNF